LATAACVSAPPFETLTPSLKMRVGIVVDRRAALLRDERHPLQPVDADGGFRVQVDQVPGVLQCRLAERDEPGRDRAERERQPDPEAADKSADLRGGAAERGLSAGALFLDELQRVGGLAHRRRNLIAPRGDELHRGLERVQRLRDLATAERFEIAFQLVERAVMSCACWMIGRPESSRQLFAASALPVRICGSGDERL
jgi:hypothetical protein